MLMCSCILRQRHACLHRFNHVAALLNRSLNIRHGRTLATHQEGNRQKKKFQLDEDHHTSELMLRSTADKNCTKYPLVVEDEKVELNKFNPQVLDELGLENHLKNEGLKPTQNDEAAVCKSRRFFFEETYSNSVDVFCNYIQACLYAGLFTHVLNIMEVRFDSIKKLNSNVNASQSAKEIKVFDIILCRLSAIAPTTLITSNFSGTNVSPLTVIQKLFEELDNLNVKPSALSYAAMLEALDKCEKSNVKIALCIQQLKDDGYTLDDVVKSCIPGSRSVHHVMNAVTQVALYNDYVPEISKLCAHEDSESPPDLVKDFYTDKTYRPGSLKLAGMSKENIDKKYVEQVNRERSRLLVVKNILAKKPHSMEVQEKKRHLQKTIDEWRVVLLKEFRNLKSSLRAKHTLYHKDSAGNYFAGKGGKLYPFFCLLPEDEYVNIMVNQLLSGGDSTVVVNYNMGTEVYAKFALKRMKDTGIMMKLKKVYRDYKNIFYNQQIQASLLPRHYWLQLEEQHGLTNLEEKIIPWTQFWTLSVGTKLAEIMSAALFTPYSPGASENINRVPAVYNCYVLSRKKRYGMTIPHPFFRNLLKDAFDNLLFESCDAPMVVPPRPWCNVTKGGFLLDQSKAMRFSHMDGNFQTRDGLQPPISNQVFDSLNIVGSVAWRVNQPILDLQIKYFRNKGNKELSIAQPPSESDPMPDMSKIPHNTEKYERIRKQARDVQKQREEMYALYMEALYKFSIANEYRDDVIWFPHNIDFRGRSYPIQKHLNYMGSDVYRALFSFGEGRPLGENGLDWLKIHCINLTELKKHSPMKERLAYADEIIDLIIASADNPDAEDAWWKKADKPWQTLAACIEITKAIRSPDPKKFISTLPIHQDGSCNGLQHYAALGRDVLGARQVNLSPSETQQDVYVGVAEKAEELRIADAQNGIEIAKKLDGFVRRKVVKQTVMTTVYGVTRYGGKRQIMRQLGYLEGQFPKEDCSQGANYLVGRVFDGITEIFSGAKNIQAWLTELAQVVSKMGHAVDWVTPLELLVVQPYFKTNCKYIKSPIQRITVHETILDTPDKVRQVNGFPPNFIHSLDSTHMMLTAMQCYKNGVTFSSVHDCFWTHASTVDDMGRICREQFVALHSQRILYDLADHLRKHLPPSSNHEELTPLQQKLNYLLSNVPHQGNFDLNEVLKSTFFFS